MHLTSGREPVCAITGAGGYVGGVIARDFESRGWTVRRITRASGYSLDGTPAAGLWSAPAVDVLVHCAYDFSAASWTEIQRLNIDGSRRLFDAAARAGVGQMVFISSLAAYEGCKSLYGRGKYAVERDVIACGGHVIRPGTIYGPDPGGMMGALGVLAARRWVPVIRHPQTLRLTHEQDLSALVTDVVTQPAAGKGPWLAAHPRTWQLGTLVREMARRRGRQIYAVPIPWPLVWTGLKALERVGLKPSFRSDSVLSLAYPAPDEEIARLRVSAHVRFRDY